MIGVGCCVGSWTRFYANSWTWPQERITTRSGQTSIAVAYNLILDELAAFDLDGVMLVHDDLEITDPEADAKFRAALTEPDVALVGIAGGGTKAGLAWWDDNPIGHQRIDTGMIDFGTRAGDVDHIEGSIMVLSPWAVENLRFDEQYPGFHGYDEIGTVARQSGKRVAVVDVDTHHHTTVGFPSKESHETWCAADRRFREKWKL